MQQHHHHRFNPSCLTAVAAILGSSLVARNYSAITSITGALTRIVYAPGHEQCARTFGIYLGLDNRRVVSMSDDHISDIDTSNSVLFVGDADEIKNHLGKFAPKSGRNKEIVSSQQQLGFDEVMVLVVRPISHKTAPKLIRTRFGSDDGDGASAKSITTGHDAMHGHGTHSAPGQTERIRPDVTA